MKKVLYYVLIACAAWLLLYQVIIWIFYAIDKNAHPANADPKELEYLNYLVSLLTIIVSLFTVSASRKQLKLLSEVAETK
jgi:hypothetical protein